MCGQSDPSLDTLIQAARADFARRLAAKASELDNLVERSDWAEARRAAHKLCGSAGVYGFGTLGVIAAALEEVLMSAGSAPDLGARATIREKLEEIRIEVERALRQVS